jgi:hypothetical protein
MFSSIMSWGKLVVSVVFGRMLLTLSPYLYYSVACTKYSLLYSSPETR